MRRKHIESRYDRISEIGEKAESPPLKTTGRKGRYKRTKGRNLVERLIGEKGCCACICFQQRSSIYKQSGRKRHKACQSQTENIQLLSHFQRN